MTSRHLVITGASTGIGRATVIGLAPDFHRVTLVGRSADRHRPVLSELRQAGIDPWLVECDLSSLGSVASAAASIQRPIDVLIANAGVGGQRGITRDGFEIHFGVNHLAHHLLITELADSVVDRVVIISSNTHFDAGRIDYDRVTRRTRSLTGFPEYRVSKLANVWCGRELARRYPFSTHTVHPGMVASDIWRRIPPPLRSLYTRRLRTVQEGAETPIWAAREAGLGSGGYFARCAPRTPSAAARDDAAAAELWTRSEAWVQPFRRVP